jgi:CDP-diacylglycerol--serine O-phosphatidyltransferase
MAGTTGVSDSTARGRARRRLRQWRIFSPTGAPVVPFERLDARTRIRVTIPSIFTTLNMTAGFCSVFVAFRGYFAWAAALIAFAIVMDIADGAVARMVGAASPFGVQLDSMADLISFGVAPAVLVHTWALPQWPVLAWASAFFWLACAGFRLARFNVTVDPTADKRYFIGLPSPGAAGVIIATVFALDSVEHGPWLFLPLAIGVMPAALMVTTVRFRSFRNLLSLRGNLWPHIIGLVAIVAGLATAPGATGLVVAYGYVLTAPLGWLTRPLRLRWFGEDAVAPPRTRMPSVFLPVVTEDDPSALDDVDDQVCGDDQQPDPTDDPGASDPA